MEGTYSIWHLILMVVIFVIPAVVPVWGIRKAGWSGWWCLLFAVPLANLILLWVFAFGNWPNEPSALEGGSQPVPPS